VNQGHTLQILDPSVVSKLESGTSLQRLRPLQTKRALLAHTKQRPAKNRVFPLKLVTLFRHRWRKNNNLVVRERTNQRLVNLSVLKVEKVSLLQTLALKNGPHVTTEPFKIHPSTRRVLIRLQEHT
jgi:hypothetical protein